MIEYLDDAQRSIDEFKGLLDENLSLQIKQQFYPTSEDDEPMDDEDEPTIEELEEDDDFLS